MTAYTARDPVDKPPGVVTISRFRHKRDTCGRALNGEALVLWRDAGPRCPGCVPVRRRVGTWLTSRAGEPPRLAWTAGVGGPSGREAA